MFLYAIIISNDQTSKNIHSVLVIDSSGSSNSLSCLYSVVVSGQSLGRYSATWCDAQPATDYGTVRTLATTFDAYYIQNYNFIQ